MSTPSSVGNSSPTAKVDTEVLSEERLTSESSDATLSGGNTSSVPSLSSELNDVSTTTAAVASTSARGDIDCGGNDGNKISSVEKKKSVLISEGDSSNDKATTTDSDMEDCQEASGSSSEVSGVAERAGDNPPVADSSTSTATEEINSVAKSSQVNGKDTASSLPSVRGSEDQSGDITEVNNSAGSERDESTTVRHRVCHLILSPASTQM